MQVTASEIKGSLQRATKRSPMSPTEVKTMLVRQTVFDLDTFEDVTRGRLVVEPHASSMAEALTLVNGDHAALLDVINDGLIERARANAKGIAEGWFILSDTNPNELTDKPFVGTPASSKGVRQTIMTLAKTVFGYVSGRNITDAQKAKNVTAKEKAENMVKNNADIRDGLKAAAMTDEE